MVKRTLSTSLRYAWRGVLFAIKTERNMRIHVVLGLLALTACGWFRVTAMEWLIVILAIASVLVAELINTAVEVLVNLLSQERRVKAMIIKDLAAGAVLVASVSAALVWGVVFLPRLAGLFAPNP